MNSNTPTVILVHGAFADASSWAGVTERLQLAGVKVQAVSNPLRGLTSDGEYVASVVKQTTGPVLLVGHSYGGPVITYAGAKADNVKVKAVPPPELLALAESLAAADRPR